MNKESYFKTLNGFVDLLNINSIELDWSSHEQKTFVIFNGDEYFYEYIYLSSHKWYPVNYDINNNNNNSETIDKAIEEKTINSYQKVTTVLTLNVFTTGEEPFKIHIGTEVYNSSEDTEIIHEARKKALEDVANVRAKEILETKSEYVKMLLAQGEDVFNFNI